MKRGASASLLTSAPCLKCLFRSPRVQRPEFRSNRRTGSARNFYFGAQNGSPTRMS
jgi:hypothetical protein